MGAEGALGLVHAAWPDLLCKRNAEEAKLLKKQEKRAAVIRMPLFAACLQNPACLSVGGVL